MPTDEEVTFMESIFKRYEKKYLVTREQAAALQDIFLKNMEPDHYGAYLVQNLYYDTENWDAIRESVEKPSYKEKLRLRCYGTHSDGADYFLELKKKFKGIVYKRRIAIPARSLYGGPVREAVSKDNSQIARELGFYLKSNAVSEKIYIAYRRTAFAGIKDDGLRVTFDTDMHFRMDTLNFTHPYTGHLILPENTTLMEVKTLGGMPLWMASALSENRIFPTTFSKYGACYTGFIMNKQGIAAERMVKLSA
jgi:hypothetical protein